MGHIRVAFFPLALQSFKTVGLLEPVIDCLDRGAADQVLLGFPETAVNGHIGKRNGIHKNSAFHYDYNTIITALHGKSRLTTIQKLCKIFVTGGHV